jgi:transcription antitermination factor NusG
MVGSYQLFLMLDMKNPNAIRWLVCHTKSRCEKKFAGLLEAAGITYYLPLIEQRHVYVSGAKRYTKPLFPGYVFVHVLPEKQKRIYEQQLIVRTLAVQDERMFLKQLDHVRAVLAAGIEVALQPLLSVGRAIRVTEGPLRGVEGFVDESSRDGEIVIKVDILQQGLRVLVPVEWLEGV